MHKLQGPQRQQQGSAQQGLATCLGPGGFCSWKVGVEGPESADAVSEMPFLQAWPGSRAHGEAFPASGSGSAPGPGPKDCQRIPS